MPKNTPERIIDYPASSAGRASTTTAGATSTATTLADHDHLGGLGSGGVLTGYATATHAHGASQIGQVVMTIDGSTIAAYLPLTGPGGWLVNNDGILLIAG